MHRSMRNHPAVPSNRGETSWFSNSRLGQRTSQICGCLLYYLSLNVVCLSLSIYSLHTNSNRTNQMVGEVWRSTALQKDSSKYGEITSCKYDPKRATSNCVIQFLGFPGFAWACFTVYSTPYLARDAVLVKENQGQLRKYKRGWRKRTSKY